jgi:hypothetical protein
MTGNRVPGDRLGEDRKCGPCRAMAPMFETAARRLSSRAASA